MNQWNDRKVLVTGGSRGIGAGITEYFLELGAQVLATSTTPEGAAALKERHPSEKFQAEVLDLSDRLSITEFLARRKSDLKAVDTLINNAGITDDRLSIQVSPAQWDKVIETNLSGTFFLTQGILRSMIRARFGRVVFLSSVVSFTGSAGQVSYCATKAGLEGMMKALALEVASRGITVNNIAPGFIETDMTNKLSEEQRMAAKKRIPMDSFGNVQDIAYACGYLASLEARYMTGQTLHLNGGMFIG